MTWLTVGSMHRCVRIFRQYPRLAIVIASALGLSGARHAVEARVLAKANNDVLESAAGSSSACSSSSSSGSSSSGSGSSSSSWWSSSSGGSGSGGGGGGGGGGFSSSSSSSSSSIYMTRALPTGRPFHHGTLRS